MIDPSAVIAAIAKEFQTSVQANHSQLVVDLSRAPGHIVADKAKLEQIVTELLTNAVKFTRDGRIDLMIETPEPDHLTVTVRDTGGGIAPELLPVLFEQFVDAGDANGSKYGGARLGLALSQKIARLSGGEITVESRPGAGSTFVLHLPPAPDRAQPAMNLPSNATGASGASSRSRFSSRSVNVHA
jgi:signal transduction histidine kinase